MVSSRKLLYDRLAAAGNRDEALDFHLKAALKQGLSPVDIAEALMQLSVYAGFPTALNAFGLAQRAFSADRGAPAITAPSAAAQLSESRELRWFGLDALPPDVDPSLRRAVRKLGVRPPYG